MAAQARAIRLIDELEAGEARRFTQQREEATQGAEKEAQRHSKAEAEGAHTQAAQRKEDKRAK